MTAQSDNLGKETLVSEIERIQLESALSNSLAGLKISSKKNAFPFGLALREKSFEELKKLYLKSHNNEEKFILARIAHKEKTAFYHEKKSRADFNYWHKIHYATIDQLTALSLNKDPRFVTLERINELDENLPFCQRYMDRYNLILQSPLGLSRKKILLLDFIKWAVDSDLKIPKKLISKVQDGKNFIGTDILINNLQEEIRILQDKLLTVADNKSHSKANKSKNHAIGALLCFICGELGVQKHPEYKNQTQFIEFISKKMEGYSGMSVRNLSTLLPAAKNLISKEE